MELPDNVIWKIIDHLDPATRRDLGGKPRRLAHLMTQNIDFTGNSIHFENGIRMTRCGDWHKWFFPGGSYHFNIQTKSIIVSNGDGVKEWIHPDFNEDASFKPTRETRVQAWSP